MQLSSEQIAELFEFTRKKYVHFYDLQCEIVDHLAASIEENLTENDQLSFEDALADVYKGFGIYGFAHIVREKEKQIDKQFGKLLLGEIKNLFVYPHFIFSALVFFVIYTITNAVPLGYLYPGATIFSFLFLIVITIRWKQIPKPVKPLRMFSGNLPYLVFLPYVYAQFLIQFYDRYEGEASRWPFILFTFFSVIYIIANFRIFKQMRRKAMNLYPEAFHIAAS